MEVTPIAAEGRQIIERYGGGGFRVSGEVFEGSVLVHPERTLSWPVAALAELTLESLEPLLVEGGRSVDVLLLGCGTSMALVPEALRQGARERGVVIVAGSLRTVAEAREARLAIIGDRALGLR